MMAFSYVCISYILKSNERTYTAVGFPPSFHHGMLMLNSALRNHGSRHLLHRIAPPLGGALIGSVLPRVAQQAAVLRVRDGLQGRVDASPAG